MDPIKDAYRKAKRLYWALLMALLGIVVAFGFVSPSGEHRTTALEGIMFLALFVIAGAMYLVLRCPKCRAFLSPTYSRAWGRLRYCPGCGVALAEDHKETGNR